MDGLERFVDAQADTYRQTLTELRAGAKRSHWMWFVFPQIAGLGRSETARFYAIADQREALDYLSHDILGPRLIECTQAMLAWSGRKSARDVLGAIDALKFASSMTLFDRVGDEAIFGRALDAFNAGERDPLTLEKLV